jgi:hypothetical protein
MSRMSNIFSLDARTARIISKVEATGELFAAARGSRGPSKHTHSSADTIIQYHGRHSRHSRDQALTNIASDRHTGATCLKRSRTIEALAQMPSSLVSLSLSPAASKYCKRVVRFIRLQLTVETAVRISDGPRSFYKQAALAALQ